MSEKFVLRVLQQDLAVDDLILDALAREGFEILDLGVVDGAAGLVSRLLISSELMTGLPAAAGFENVVPVLGVDTNIFMLLSRIKSVFPDVPTYKVSSGERLVLTSDGAAGVGYVFYRELGEGDIPKPEQPGGSNSKVRLTVSHGRAFQTDVAVGTFPIRALLSLNPAGQSAFPFGVNVPNNQEMSLLGFAVALGSNSEADVTLTGIRFWKEQSSILARDEAWADPALFPYPIDTAVRPHFLFPKPIVFKPNEEFLVEAQVVNGGAGVEDAEVIFSFFFLQKYL